MDTKDTFKIICSFLNPLELVVCRKLSRYTNIWTSEYIYSKFKTLNIEDYVCPNCGDFINTDDISNYTDFNDYFLMEEYKRQRFDKINEWFDNKYIFKVERKNMLCDRCEVIEDYNDNFYLYFRYKGSRKYSLVSYYSLNSWSALCVYNTDKNKGYWNEYRKVLSCIFEEFHRENGEDLPLENWNTWDNDNNEEEDNYDNYDGEYNED
jgi:hypothetical protein